MPRIEFRSISKTYSDGTPAVCDFNLTIEDGEFLSILGPSGSGKSSMLRMLAGLEQISAGDLLVDGRRVNNLSPRARDMAMVFENYALYPHLDVYHNVAMPLVARRIDKTEIRRRVNEVCEVLHLTECVRQRPQTLSGGQRQRVALARALIRRPSTFLMDEPLGHLEAYMRAKLRAEIRRLHEERRATTVYITHDQEEAGAVADRIAVVNAGRLQQFASLPVLIDDPVNRFVAAFVGKWPINLLPVTVIRDGEMPALRVGDGKLSLAPAQAAVLAKRSEETLELGLRPDDLELTAAGSEQSFSGRVVVVEPQGGVTIVIVDTGAGRISVVMASGKGVEIGSSVGIKLSGTGIHLFAFDGSSLFAGLRNAGTL
jgi:ABC-type sugar transport system ATPase subunit